MAQLEEAIIWLRRSVEANPELGANYYILAGACSLLGHHKEAEAALSEYKRLLPNMTIGKLRAAPLSDHPAYLAWRERHFRNLIVLTAFSVVLGTLVIQGFTLRPLLLWLDLHDDDPVGREVSRARETAYRAALAAIDGDTSPLAQALRIELEAALEEGTADQPGNASGSPADSVRLRAIAAARRAVLAMRSCGEIGDEAFHRLEEEIDRVELSIS